MFCEETPCVCNKPAPKAVAKRIPKPKPVTVEPKPVKVVEAEEEPTPRPRRMSAVEAMKAAAHAKEAPKPIVEDRVLPQRAMHEEYTPEFQAAVTALADILHVTELRKYKDILETPQPEAVAYRRDAWKERRNGMA